MAERADVCPYRGLQAFHEEHAEYYFGREADIQRLVERLKASRFLAVIGPSGSGKSSLARAGLVPALRADALPGSGSWTIRVMKPGPQPLLTLAGLLLQLHPHDSMRATIDEMRADSRTLHFALALAMADRPPEERVVWVIDQLEEVFTLCSEEEERAQFLANLVYAAAVPGGRTVVVPTLRADFYPRCAAYPELSQVIAGQQFLVSPMTPDGLREAIVEPALRVGLEFEEGLVTRS